MSNFKFESYNIVGATVCWNQLVQGGDFPIDFDNDHIPGYWNRGGSIKSFTANSGIGCIEFNPGSNSSKGIWQSISIPENDVFAIKITWKEEPVTSAYVTIRVGMGPPSPTAPPTTSGGVKQFNANYFSSFSGFKTEYIILKSVSSDNNRFWIWTRSNTNTVDDQYDKLYIKNINYVNLTKLFGDSTIANYIYNHRNDATPSIDTFKEWGFFNKNYYSYNQGSLKSVNISAHKTYDSNGNLIGNYSINSSTEFRGLFKLDANNKLYADGDIYEPDGKITRNYELRAYQPGDESNVNAITDKRNTVVKLNNSIEESTQPFVPYQIVDLEGKEEFIDLREVPIPVGNDTKYYEEVKEIDLR